MANHENDQLYVTNPTKEYFEVKWGGYPYGVQPGQQVIFPRFIAEHFAKHLADRILLRKEKAYKEQHGKDKPFLNNRKERPPVVKSILTGVYSYFQQRGAANDPNAVIAQQVAQMNAAQPGQREPKPMNLGVVDTSPAMGALEDDDDDEPQTADPAPLNAVADPGPQVPQAQLAQQPQQPLQPAAPHTPPPMPNAEATAAQTAAQQPAAPAAPAPANPPAKRNRDELFAEAKQLGLKPKATMSNDELENMIKNF